MKIAKFLLACLLGLCLTGLSESVHVAMGEASTAAEQDEYKAVCGGQVSVPVYVTVNDTNVNNGTIIVKYDTDVFSIDKTASTYDTTKVSALNLVTAGNATITFNAMKIATGYTEGRNLAATLVFNVISTESHSEGIEMTYKTNPPNLKNGTTAINVTASTALVKIYKDFNAQDTEYAANWDDNTSITPEEGTFTYTSLNEEYEPVACKGVINAIDTSKITLTVGNELISDYATNEAQKALYGTFALVEGEIVWTQGSSAEARAAIQNQTMIFDVPFTAYKQDEPTKTDSKVYTLTITPVNQIPTIGLVKSATLKEGEAVALSFAIDDPEKDYESLNLTKVVLSSSDEAETVSMELKGTWTREGGTWTYTPAENETIDYGFILHPTTEREWILTIDGQDGDDEFELTLTRPDTIAKVQDTDREVYLNDPTAIKLNGVTAADVTTWKRSQGDLTATATGAFSDLDPEDITQIVIAYKWGTQAGATLAAADMVKGNVFALKITGTGYAGTTASQEYTVCILNSEPTIQVTNLSGENYDFVQKDGTQKSRVYEIKVSDADEDTLTVTAALNATNPAIAEQAQPVWDDMAKVWKYTVNFNDSAEAKATVTLTVSDDETQAQTQFAIDYLQNPAPVKTVQAPQSGLTYSEYIAGISEGDDTVALTVSYKDQKIDGEVEPGSVVEPSGVADFNFKATVTAKDGGSLIENYPQPENLVTLVSKGTSAGEGEAQLALNLNLADPEIVRLFNEKRPGEVSVSIEVQAKDGNGVWSAYEEVWKFTIKDTDRAPAAPTAIELSDTELFTGKTVNAIITKAEVEDPDGDTVIYEYEFIKVYQGENVSQTCVDGNWPFGTETLKKNDTIQVKVTAKSTPAYSTTQLTSETVATETIAVGNSDPTGKTLYTEDKPKEIDEYGNQEAATSTEFSFVFAKLDAESSADVTVWDPDVNVDRDSLVYSLDAATLNDYATVVLNEENSKVTVTPKQFKYVAEGAAVPYFILTATDDDQKAVNVKVYVNITPVNTKPEVKNVSDIYILPQECDGTTVLTKEFKVSPGANEVESTQVVSFKEIAAIRYSEGAEGHIFVDTPSFVINENVMTISYTLKTDAKDYMGASIEFDVTIQDNGKSEAPNVNEGTQTFTFVLGSTPWYPIVQLPVEGKGDYQVTLKDEAGSVAATVIVTDSDTLKPADYYYQGVEGFESNAVLTGGVQKWNAQTGATGEVSTVEVIVPEYDKPSVPVVEYKKEGSRYTFSINAPLSASYVLTIKKGEELYKSISKDFTPNAEGIIIPSDTFALDLTEGGTYEVSAYGINPEGEGVASEAITFNVEEAGDQKLEWPEDGVFTPEGKTIFVNPNTESVDVKFSWPVVSAAEGYVLCIQGQTDSFYKEIETSKNSEIYTVAITRETMDFAWCVIAVDAKGNELASSTFNFNIATQSDYPIVKSVELEDTNKLVLNIDAKTTSGVSIVSAEIQVAHLDNVNKTVTWFNYMKEGNVEYDNGGFTLPGAQLVAGDVAFIRYTYSDGSVSESKIYTLK